MYMGSPRFGGKLHDEDDFKVLIDLILCQDLPPSSDV